LPQNCHKSVLDAAGHKVKVRVDPISGSPVARFTGRLAVAALSASEITAMR
jgi:hypothetical protein